MYKTQNLSAFLKGMRAVSEITPHLHTLVHYIFFLPKVFQHFHSWNLSVKTMTICNLDFGVHYVHVHYTFNQI